MKAFLFDFSLFPSENQVIGHALSIETIKGFGTPAWSLHYVSWAMAYTKAYSYFPIVSAWQALFPACTFRRKGELNGPHKSEPSRVTLPRSRVSDMSDALNLLHQ